MRVTLKTGSASLVCRMRAGSSLAFSRILKSSLIRSMGQKAMGWVSMLAALFECVKVEFKEKRKMEHE
jgi:hypothetical protein